MEIPAITYLKDPESSELGRNIVSGSIDLIEEIGFDDFTFRKLAESIQSTEASVYRYFENKHKLLLYLTIWYWQWMEYRLLFALANVPDPKDKMDRCLQILTSPVQEDSSYSHINEVKLHHIVINESAKTYLTRMVDDENKSGAFKGFKRVVALVSDVVLEINPAFKYPHMLISTVVEGVHHQRFFANHLPSLTDSISGEDSISNFYTKMVYQTITTRK
jgi:AcrR family transcriptional regulator